MDVECPITRNIRLLEDKDPMVRQNAAEMLGRTMNKKAVTPLIKLLQKEKEQEVRRSIVLSLSLLSSKEVLPILFNVLLNESDAETRRNAAGGLRFFADSVKAVDLVNLILKEPDKTIRDVLVGTTIYLRDESLIQYLLELFQKEIIDDELKECLLEIISIYDNPKVKDLIIECSSFNHSEPIRFIATRAIGKMNDVKSIALLYEIFQNDESERIRMHAQKVLDEISIALGYSSIDHMLHNYREQTQRIE